MVGAMLFGSTSSMLFKLVPEPWLALDEDGGFNDCDDGLAESCWLFVVLIK